MRSVVVPKPERADDLNDKEGLMKPLKEKKNDGLEALSSLAGRRTQFSDTHMC